VKKSLFQKTVTHLILIVILGLIAYSNTFHVPFHFDDYDVIVNNPIIKDLQFFVEPSKAQDFDGHFEYNTFKRRYIAYLTFALNYKFYGLNVASYHLLNLSIHIGNALLIYLLVILSFKTPYLKESTFKIHNKYIAVFTVLLFACHPIQTQAVTYIWQRVASLSTMFYLLSLVAYVKWRLSTITMPSSTSLNFPWRGAVPLYVLSFISAVLAMKTKEIAFMLPVIVALYEFMFFKDKIKRKILYLFPLFLTMLIIPITLLSIDQPLGELIGDISEEKLDSAGLTRWQYLLTEFRVIVTYIRLIFLPIHQNLDYDYPVYYSFFQSGVFLSFVLLLLIVCFGVYLFYRYRLSAAHTRLITFGIFWFFINLILESSIIPLSNIIFEHRMYLPSIGVFLIMGTLLCIGIEKFKDKWIGINRLIISALSVIIIMLTVATYLRNNVWKDEISLWQDVVSKSPNKAGGHYSLGFAYVNLGLIDNAIEHYRIALSLNPNYRDVYMELGFSYMSKGLLDKAIELFNTAIKLNPELPDAHINLGIAYDKKGLTDKAIKQYIIALRRNPDFVEAHYNLGLVYLRKNSFEKSIQHFHMSLKLNPYDADAHYYIGIAYRSQGLIKKANEHFRIAQRLNPSLFKKKDTHN
jgi:tetratricopeptide (TPR) repeat protein